MDAVELVLAIGGSSALSGAGASAVTAWVGRRLRKAQVGQITEEAHKQIYAAYGELLDELRAELTAARGEVSRLRGELAESRARGEQVAAEMGELRARLDAAEQREAALTAEVTRLGGTLPLGIAPPAEVLEVRHREGPQLGPVPVCDLDGLVLGGAQLLGSEGVRHHLVPDGAGQPRAVLQLGHEHRQRRAHPGPCSGLPVAGATGHRRAFPQIDQFNPSIRHTFEHIKEMTMPNAEDIAHRFAFHPATTEEKRDAHASVRQHCRELADFLNERLPEGREKSLALTACEEAMLWGNAALARQNAEG